jgi:hypothetical protein
MAIEALVTPDGQFEHHSRHDLKSFLYVIFYICTFTSGPRTLRPKGEIPVEDSMHAWFSNKKLTTIGFLKASHVAGPHLTITPYFSEYWHDFAPFAIELTNLAFPGNIYNPNQLTYQNMHAVLQKAYDAVEEPIRAKTQMSTILRSKRLNLDIGLHRLPKKARK